MNRSEFGELVAALRQDLGWTQSQLAEYSGMEDAVISQIERGVKKFFEANLLFNLANAFQLTTLERREFFFAASGLEDKQIVRQPAKGTTTDTFHPSRIVDNLVDILAQVQVPAFITDVYGDGLAANMAVIRFFDVPDNMLETAGTIPGGYNTMRITFNKELVGRSHVADHWDSYAMSAMLTYRASTLRYRAKPYFKYLMKEFRNPVEYPLFERFWKRVSSLEEDRIINSDLFTYRHREFGEIKYLTTEITTTTSFGELFLTTYQSLDHHTSKILSGLMEDGGNAIVRLAPWPGKTMV